MAFPLKLISVFDRLPGNADCNDNLECWVSDAPGHVWELRCIKYDNAYDYWLPFNSISYPLAEASAAMLKVRHTDKDGNEKVIGIDRQEASRMLSEYLTSLNGGPK